MSISKTVKSWGEHMDKSAKAPLKGVPKTNPNNEFIKMGAKAKALAKAKK